MSEAAVAELVASGAKAIVGLAGHLPYPDATFDLVAAFDILEHVDDDEEVLSELSRAAAPAAVLLLSAPLHPHGGRASTRSSVTLRRYRPDDLVARLNRRRWSVEGSCVFGMQPRSTLLSDLAAWSLERRRSRAIWCYSHLLLPLGKFFQRKLELRPGMIDTKAVDEILLVCRRSDTRARPGVG